MTSLPNPGSLQIDHNWVGDLTIELEHVSTGTIVTLMDRPGHPVTTFGCQFNDINAYFSDLSTDPVENECEFGPPAIGGSFLPNQPLLSGF